MSVFRRKRAKDQKPLDVDPASDDGMIGLYYSILERVGADFSDAVAMHLQRLHEPGGYEREKSEHDFMDLGMPRTYLQALDNVEFTIEDTVGVPQLGLRKRGMAVFVTRWKVQGEHNRPLAGVPPTGDQITIEGLTYTAFRNYNVRTEYTYWHMPELTRRVVER